MAFRIETVTPPAHEPLDMTELKQFRRIDGTDQDDVLARLITSVRRQVERYTNRVMVTQTLRLNLDNFPGAYPRTFGYMGACGERSEIRIPLGPVTSIESFKYKDPTTGDLIELTEDEDFEVSLGEERTRLRPAPGKSWPTAQVSMDAVQIEFIAGYGDAQASPAVGTEPPAELIQAMWLKLGSTDENREGQTIPEAVKDLLRDYRTPDFMPVVWDSDRY